MFRQFVNLRRKSFVTSLIFTIHFRNIFRNQDKIGKMIKTLTGNITRHDK